MQEADFLESTCSICRTDGMSWGEYSTQERISMPERAVPGRNSLEGLIDVGSWLPRHVRKRCEADIGLAVCNQPEECAFLQCLSEC